MTADYASINIAGPCFSANCSPASSGRRPAPAGFPYMRVRTGTIAGVAECYMWRIGFTGELSFEIHIPPAWGPYVWESLVEAGRISGVGPSA